MGFPAGVLQVQKCEQDLNAPQFVLLNGSVSVFVFVVKEGFYLSCLPQDYKNKIEISELVEFLNKRLTKFFVFTAKRELDENFLSFFEEKFGMMLSSWGEWFRKLLIVCEIKRFG